MGGPVRRCRSRAGRRAIRVIRVHPPRSPGRCASVCGVDSRRAVAAQSGQGGPAGQASTAASTRCQHSMPAQSDVPSGAARRQGLVADRVLVPVAQAGHRHQRPPSPLGPTHLFHAAPPTRQHGLARLVTGWSTFWCGVSRSSVTWLWKMSRPWVGGGVCRVLTSRTSLRWLDGWYPEAVPSSVSVSLATIIAGSVAMLVENFSRSV